MNEQKHTPGPWAWNGDTLVWAYVAHRNATVIDTSNGHDEYRRAVCAVLAATLWNYWRSDIPTKTENAGNVLRTWARDSFGARMQKRWFD